MIGLAKAVMALLDHATRRRLLLVVGSSLFLALLEMLGLILILPLVQVLTSTGEPHGFARAIQRLLHVTDTQFPAVLSGIVLVAFLTKGLVSIWLLSRNANFLLRREAAMATRLLTAYLRAPYVFHLQRNDAESLNRIEASTTAVFLQVLGNFIVITAECAVIVAILAVLFLLQPLAALGMAAYFGVLAVGYQRVSQSRASAAGLVIHNNGIAIYKLVLDSLQVVKELAVSGRSDFFVRELDSLKTEMLASRRTTTVLSQLPRYYLETVMLFGLALLSVILIAVQGQAAGIAAVGLFLAAGFRLLPSLNKLLSSVSSLKYNQPAVAAIQADFTLLGLTADPSATERATALAVRRPFERGLSFERVSFSYPGSDVRVVDDVSFTIERGRAIGLVGPSGSGKTTVADIVLGLLEPASGRVLVDGHDLFEDVPGWRRLIGYVPQEVHLLDDTLAANVALGVPPAAVDQQALKDALDLAQLTAVVRELPDGVQTRMGERGTRLSGGQRQRLGIARALYERPEVLVLDEATSALDVRTESMVTATIENLRGRLTMVVIAHRLSTVRRCDGLIYLKDGRVHATGTFEEVERSTPDFAEAVRMSGLDVPREV